MRQRRADVGWWKDETDKDNEQLAMEVVATIGGGVATVGGGSGSASARTTTAESTRSSTKAAVAVCARLVLLLSRG